MPEPEPEVVKAENKATRARKALARGGKRQVWGLGNVEKAREHYKGLKEKASLDLSTLESKHGDKGAVDDLYMALNGSWEAPPLTTTGLKRRFKRSEIIIQDGIVDLLKEGKKFNKMKASKQAVHLEKMKDLVDQLGKLEEHDNPPEMRNTLHSKLGEYLEQANKLHNEEITADEFNVDVDELHKNVQSIIKKLKPVQKKMDQLNIDKTAYEHMENYANNRFLLFPLNWQEYWADGRKASTISSKFFKLKLNKDKTDQEQRRFKKLKKDYDDIKTELDEDGHFVTSVTEPQGGKSYSKMTIRRDDLSEEWKEALTKYDKDTKWGYVRAGILGAGVGLGAGLGAVALLLGLSAARNTKLAIQHAKDLQYAQDLIASQGSHEVGVGTTHETVSAIGPGATPPAGGSPPGGGAVDAVGTGTTGEAITPVGGDTGAVAATGSTAGETPGITQEPVTPAELRLPKDPDVGIGSAIFNKTMFVAAKAGALHALISGQALKTQYNNIITNFKKELKKNPGSVLNTEQMRAAVRAGSRGVPPQELAENLEKPTLDIIRKGIDNAEIVFSNKGFTLIWDKNPPQADSSS